MSHSGQKHLVENDLDDAFIIIKASIDIKVTLIRFIFLRAENCW